MSGHYLGLYWGERKQSIDECVTTMAAVVEQFATAGYLLDVLVERAEGVTTRTSFSPNLSNLRQALARDRDRATIRRPVEEGSGYSIVLTSQNSGDEGYTVSARLGSFGDEFKNCVVLSFPKIGALSFASNRKRIDMLRLNLEDLLDPDRVHLGQ